ncbi:MAG: lysine--tRNA ligase [Candidatus Parcubacteria bacterium]|nr:MAG: lysine--tRNA ligase [Candidatus Parcubacteria bacterium]
MPEDKLKMIKDLGINPYPDTVPKPLAIEKLVNNFDKLIKQQKKVWLGGRVMSLREHGKITFLNLKDFSGKVQIIIKAELIPNYEQFLKIIDIGDIVLFYGEAFLTKTKEKSLLASKWCLGAKVLKNFSNEYYKVKDEELLLRHPYLRTIFYDETKTVFYHRFKLLESLRKILWQEGFLEVETPILQLKYGGALAKPFVTYLESLKEKLYLRIAPEISLKKMLVGGFEKIFEIGKNFRNEGIDREHNPEFTMIELYWAYQNLEGLMRFTEKILKKLIKQYNQWRGQNNLAINFNNYVIDLDKKWQRYEYISLFKEITGLDYFHNSLQDFINFASKNDIHLNPKVMNKGKIADEIFKKKIRPQLVQPTFLLYHPKDISPLAKAHPQNDNLTLRFQLYLGGFEIANAFAELNDPLDQKERFEKEARVLRKGDAEAHPFDETFIEALEFAMPPAAGLGIGLDRLFTILLNKKNIQDIIYFPFMRNK